MNGFTQALPFPRRDSPGSCDLVLRPFRRWTSSRRKDLCSQSAMTAKPINQIRLVAFTTHPPKVLGRHLPIGSRMEAGRRTGALRRLIIIAIGVLVTSVIAGAGFHLWWSAPSLPTPFKPIAAGSKLASLMSEAKKSLSCERPSKVH